MGQIEAEDDGRLDYVKVMSGKLKSTGANPQPPDPEIQPQTPKSFTDHVKVMSGKLKSTGAHPQTLNPEPQPYTLESSTPLNSKP